MIFKNFPGNDRCKEQLSLAFQENRIPHAIILEGPPGSGRHTLAGILAAAAVCTAETEKPCGVCAACQKVKADSHPDIYSASGGTAARSFHVEVIRFVRSDCYIKPNEAPYKVYCLFGAETMSDQAQNALLKILEEPPAHVLFILTCASASALLPTVRSRSQIFTLEPPQDAQDDPEITELASQIVRAVAAPAEAPLLQLTAPFLKNKDLFRSVLDRLQLLFRDACVLRAGGKSLSGDPACAELASALTRDRLVALVEITAKIRRNLDQNANAALLVTVFCARLRAAAGR